MRLRIVHTLRSGAIALGKGSRLVRCRGRVDLKTAMIITLCREQLLASIVEVNLSVGDTISSRDVVGFSLNHAAILPVAAITMAVRA
jgi:hypothetical protein